MLHIGDAVNGPTLRGTTLFPATLSVGQSWNLPLYTEVVTAIRDELAAIGITWVLSPEVDVAWDPRNGRVGEMLVNSSPKLPNLLEPAPFFLSLLE